MLSLNHPIKLVLASLLSLAIFTIAGRAQAADISVCASGCDHTSIQAAVNAAASGDTILVQAGTYTEANITISKDITIRGADAATTIVQAAATPSTASGRVFNINVTSSVVSLENLTIRHGNIFNPGGGILNVGSLTITNSTIADNAVVGSRGGGIHSSGVLTLINSTVSGNTSSTYGGGIYNDKGTVTLSNSTISDNHGLSSGGVDTDFGTLNIINSTIFGNTFNSTSGGTGGGISNYGSTVNISNSIVTGNGYKSGSTIIPKEDCLNSLTSGGYNIFGSNGNPQGCTTTRHATDIVLPSAVDTLLSTTLANNGGSTQTHALIYGSLAVDYIPTANCTLATDQRGETRPTFLNCDVGAYEETTTDFSATATAYANATATANANATATANAVATANANATATASANITATANANATATEIALARTRAALDIEVKPIDSLNVNVPVDSATGAWSGNGLYGYIFDGSTASIATGGNHVLNSTLSVDINGYEYCLVGAGYVFAGYTINQDVNRHLPNTQCFTYNPDTDGDIYRIDFAVVPLREEMQAPVPDPVASSDSLGDASNIANASILNTPAPTADWAAYHAQQTATAAANIGPTPDWLLYYAQQTATALAIQPSTSDAVAQPVQQNETVAEEPSHASAVIEPTATAVIVANVDPTAIPTDIAAPSTSAGQAAQPTYTAMQIQVPLADADPAIDAVDNTISTQQWILMGTFAAGSVVAFGLLGGMALRSMVLREEE